MLFNYIRDINKTENINLEYEISRFEKKLLKCFKDYDNHYGFEDYKMNNIDYLILYEIWKNVDIRGNINNYLIIMYSYYKLEDFHFPINKFKCSLDFIDIILNTNIIYIINKFIFL